MIPEADFIDKEIKKKYEIVTAKTGILQKVRSPFSDGKWGRVILILNGFALKSFSTTNGKLFG
jgi:hypothetical protein